jgi:hypothetical protein
MSQQINLILPELRPRFDWLNLPLVAGIALAGLVLALSLSQWLAVRQARLAGEAAAINGQLLNLRQQVQILGQSLAARQPNGALPDEIAALRKGVEQRRAVLAYVGSQGSIEVPPGFSGMLQGFARQSLDGVWLVGFGLAPEAVEIRGRLLDPALLPRYIGGLNEDPAFAGRRFSTLEMQGVAPGSEPAAAAGATPPMASFPYTEFVLRTEKAPSVEKRP